MFGVFNKLTFKNNHKKSRSFLGASVFFNGTFKKIFSLCIAACLTLSSLPYFGASRVYASSSFTAESAAAAASVTDASYKNSGISVINIQDLHFNAEAQNKIYTLLEKLHKTYPDMELFIEGASENSDFGWAYSSLGKKNGDIFIEALFNSGNISGAEYFAAKAGKKINAAEDKQIYSKNLKLFAGLIEQRAENSNLLLPFEENLSKLRSKYFTPEQKKLFEIYKKHQAGLMPDDEYFDFLKKESFRHNIDIDDYPNISLYILASGSVMSVNQKKLQAQMATLFTNLKNTLSYKQYSELIAASNNLKDRQALIMYLYNNREQSGLSNYPELNKFVSSIALSDKVNQISFIMEDNNLIQSLFDNLSKDANSKNILFMSQFAGVYKKVLLASSTSYEYEYYKNETNRFKKLLSQYNLQNDLSGLSLAEISAVNFNDTNLQRNKIFIDKMLSGVIQPEKISLDNLFGVSANARAVLDNAAKSKIKVIVAGGFHTGGVNDLLNQRQISNITFTPKITSVPQEHSEKYVEYVRSLSLAENTAIPIPVYNERSVFMFAKGVLDTLYRERADKGFVLSSDEMKEAVESIISEWAAEKKEDVTGVEYLYDESSDIASVKYIDAGNQEHIVSFTSEAARGDSSENRLTTLGKFTASTVKGILKAATFDSANLALKWMYDRILQSGFEGSSEELKRSLISGTFDFDGFFETNQGLLKQFLIVLFTINATNKTAGFNGVLDNLKTSVKILIDGDCEIIISDSPALISDAGWCFAALNDIDGKKSFYVNSVLLAKLAKLNPETAFSYIQALIQHEIYEQEALHDPESAVFGSFGQYLKNNNLPDTNDDLSARTSSNFHKYLNSKEFAAYAGQSAVTKNNPAKQRQLLSFADELADSYLSRHDEISAIHTIESLLSKDISEELKNDMTLMRMGDSKVLEKYTGFLIEHLKKIIGNSDKNDYVIAFRKTDPVHIIEQVARKAAENLGIDVVFIGQDQYMDSAPFVSSNSGLRSLNGKFRILDVEEEGVAGPADLNFKKVLFVEDTGKTNGISNEVSKVLNRLNVNKILPVVLFDMRQAVIPKDSSSGKGVVDETFDMNVVMKALAIDDSKRFAEKIKELGSLNSKYVFGVLIQLMNSEKASEKEAFNRIMGYIDRDSSIIMIQNLLKAQKNNLSSAIHILPLAYEIYKMKIFEDSSTETLSETAKEQKRMESFISWISKNSASARDARQKGTLFIKSAEFTRWQKSGSPFLLIAYASLNGYGRVTIRMKTISDSEEKSLRDAGQLLWMDVIAERESEDIRRKGVPKDEREALKEHADELSKEVAAARERFDLNIQSKDSQEASAEYYAEIKKIMSEAENITRSFLRSKRKIQLSPEDYDIVVGGSLIKGNATRNSDIYYNIISKDKATAEMVNDTFIPCYEYLMRNSGLSLYLSGGLLNTYLDSSGVIDELSFINQDITDERGVAGFLDFESIRGKSVIFEKYIEHYRLLMEGRDSARTRILQQIASIIEPSVRIVSDGSFSRAERNYDGKLTFSQHLFAASSRERNGSIESFDYRWELRSLELLLKAVMMQGFKNKMLSVNEVVDNKSTDALIELLHRKGLLFPGKEGDESTKSLVRAWKIISSVRQEKAANGKEFTWTPVDANEANALDVMKKFIEVQYKEFKHEVVVEHGSTDILFTDSLKFTQTYDSIRHNNALAKIQRYMYLYGSAGKVKAMYAALMLSDATDEELNDYLESSYPEGLDETAGKSLKAARLRVVQTVKELQAIAGLPAYESLAPGFSLQNYMDLIAVTVTNTDMMIAIFSERTQNLLSIYDRVKELELAIKEKQSEIMAYTEKIKISEEGRDDEMLIENTRQDLAKAQSELSILSQELNEEETEKKARIQLFYGVFVPLASRLGFSTAFEEMRNAPFINTNPEHYSNITNDLRFRLGGKDYGELSTELHDIERELRRFLKRNGIKKPDIHVRVKGHYSVFEKDRSERTNEKKIKASEDELKKRVKELSSMPALDDGVAREEADFIRIANLERNIHDLEGIHVVVPTDERDAVMTLLPKFFEDYTYREGNIGKGKKISDTEIPPVYKLNEGIKYESEADKGFTRAKFAFSRNDDTLGELVVFSQEQYSNEVLGLFLENATKYAISHPVYKAGVIIDDERYTDDYVEVDVDFSHFDIHGTKRMIMRSDGISRIEQVTRNESLSDNMRMLRNTVSRKGTIMHVVVEYPRTENGVTRQVSNILTMPLRSTVADIVSAIAPDGGAYVLQDSSGETLDINKVIEDYLSIKPLRLVERVDGEVDYSGINADRVKTVRGKLMAKFPNGIVPRQLRPSFIDDEMLADFFKGIEIFANHQGLRNTNELYAALNAGFINESELMEFVESQKEYIVEIQTTYLGGDEQSLKVRPSSAEIEKLGDARGEGLRRMQGLISKIASEKGYVIEFPAVNQLEPNRYQVGTKIVFKGSESELKSFLSEIHATSINISEAESVSDAVHEFDINVSDVLSFVSPEQKARRLETLIKRIKLTRKDSNGKKFDLNDYSFEIKNKGNGILTVNFSGSRERMEQFMEAIRNTDLQVKYERKPSRLPLSGIVTALGRNINALIENFQEYPALAANALISIFKSETVNKVFESLFYDEKQLLLKTEARDMTEIIKNGLIESDEKYRGYDFELVISDSDRLIKDSGAYAFATIEVKDEAVEEIVDGEDVGIKGVAALYVSSAFLRALEKMNDAERAFYLNQLAMHEVGEYIELSNGTASDYGQYHKYLYDSNPDQIKLMEFCANIAKEEAERRNSQELAFEVAAALTKSDEPDAANPVDFVLICGNAEIMTFEKALELYKSGAAKKIAISGGFGRLTIPVMREAVKLGIPIAVSDSYTVTSLQQCDELAELDDAARKETIKISEAEIIKMILLDLAQQSGTTIAPEDLIIDSTASQTRQNFDNETIKNLVDSLKTPGKPVKMSIISALGQEARTQAAFNSVFRDKILSGEVEGKSVAIPEYYKSRSTQHLTEQLAGELLRLIIYSLKGDTLPSINENGFVFQGVLDSGIWAAITALLENSENKSALRKTLLGLIANTKDENGNIIFKNKEEMLSALAEKCPRDSFQYEAIKTFLSFVYYDAERNARYQKIAEQAFKSARPLSKGSLAVGESVKKAFNVPEYLKNAAQVFVFDIDNAEQNADLIAFFGKHKAKSFAVSNRRYINPDNVLFTFLININGKDIEVQAALVPVRTELGIFFNFQISVPVAYDISGDIMDAEAKAGLLETVFTNTEIQAKLKAIGLDLSNSAERLFIEQLPEDKTLFTVEAKAGRIAESANLSEEMRKVESRAKKSSVYNEKLPVAAMLRSSGDTGIGEITSLQSYIENVLKPAGIGGFTMYDLYGMDELSLQAGNYLLVDWMGIPEAQGILSKDDIAADVTERESVNKESVAKRKNLAALKVYENLSPEQRVAVDEYYALNSSWLTSFAESERNKYGIDMNAAMFARIMAMQQMFFERQLKQALSQMQDTRASMHIKDVNADNIEGVLSKWISMGITSFTLETNHADKALLDAIAAAVSKSGFFVDIAVKSADMDQSAVEQILGYGYAPVISFQNRGMYEAVDSRFVVEIDDATLQSNPDLKKLLIDSALSGAQSVEYPIGLLWGERIADGAIDNYRVPAKGSKRFGGIKFGIFSLGQKTFEESYSGAYLNAVETGFDADVSDAAENNTAGAGNIIVNGRALPVAYAAALLGSLARQNKLSEINDFENTVISIMNSLSARDTIKSARKYFDTLFADYNSEADADKKKIKAAKIVGFIQGLGENIIIGRAEGAFISKALAKVYAGLVAERELFKSGFYPASYEGGLPVENILARVQEILSSKTLGQAMLEIEPILLNLSVPAAKTGFTADLSNIEDMKSDPEKSRKTAQSYEALTAIMLDILIDKVITRDSIRKTVRLSSVEAARSILSAA